MIYPPGWVAGTLMVPLLLISMVAEMLGVHLVPPAWSPWLRLALTAPIVLWGAQPFFRRGRTSFRTWHLNMFTLVSIRVGGAFLYRLIATAAAGLFPPTFRMHGTVPVYYEAAGVVVTLVLLMRVLELRARAATGRAIRALMDLAPKTARRFASDGSEAEVSLTEVSQGNRLRVRPGEAVPVAIATFVIWNHVAPEPRFGYALLNAIAVLIIACPCALALAT